MYTILLSHGFKRSFRRLQRSGYFKGATKDRYKLVVTALQKGDPLAGVYRDHSLSGDFAAYRECHIRGDLLLIYERDENERTIVLVDIGSHPYLFG